MNFLRISEFFRKAAFPALFLALVIFALFPWFGNAIRWPGRILFFGALLIGLGGVILAFARALRNPKHVLFGVVALSLAALIVYGFLELVALIYLKVSPDRNANPFILTAPQREAIGKLVQGEPEYTTFDPVLGWAIKPDGISADGRYRANAAAFRADREYTPDKPENATRVICFGDSYTHGNSVLNDETWQHYAEAHLEGWEFLNFGVGAYGMAQACLRYRKFKENYETDVVVIGCMTDNIRRTVNVYYPFRLTRLDQTTFALAKPWASLDSAGDLVFHPNPLPSLEAYEQLLKNPEKKMREMARNDLLFEAPAPTPLGTVAGDKLANTNFDFLNRRRDKLLNRKPTRKSVRKLNPAFSEGGEIFEINCRLFEEFVTEVSADGAVPLILWFPSPKDVDRFNRRGDRIYQSFLDFFQQKSLPSADVLEWLDETYNGEIPASEVFVEGHYAPPINRLIGERLGDKLRAETR